MSAMALDAAPAAEELELPVLGGGGPGDAGPFDGGGGGGDGRDDDDPDGALQRLGVLLAMISIAALFTALCLAFLLRSRTQSMWVSVPMPRVLWLSTALLLFSSLTMQSARKALVRRDGLRYRNRLLFTGLLGLAFLSSQLTGIYELARTGAYASGNPHAALYYLFTGIHGVHLLGGLVAVNWLVLRPSRSWAREREANGTVAIYWHFMDLVWAALFGILLML